MDNGIIDNIIGSHIECSPAMTTLEARQSITGPRGCSDRFHMQLLTQELASLPVDFKPLNFLYRGNIRKLKYLWKNFLEDFVQPPKKCNLLLLPLELKHDELGTPCTGIRSDEEFREIGLLGTVYK